MNAQRRKALSAIAEALSDLREQIDFLKEEEQEYFDRMPESLQTSEKGDKAESNIDNLDEVADNLEGTMELIQEIIAN